METIKADVADTGIQVPRSSEEGARPIKSANDNVTHTSYGFNRGNKQFLMKDSVKTTDKLAAVHNLMIGRLREAD